MGHGVQRQEGSQLSPQLQQAWQCRALPAQLPQRTAILGHVVGERCIEQLWVVPEGRQDRQPAGCVGGSCNLFYLRALPPFASCRLTTTAALPPSGSSLSAASSPAGCH